MASRKEEKERARQARIEAERRHAAEQQRRRRMQLLGGAGAAVAVVVAVVLAIAFSGGNGKGDTSKPKNASSATHVNLPPRRITGLQAAAKAAGCTLSNPHWTQADRDHVAPGTKVKYKTNPPSFGDHYPVPAQDGDYVGVQTPATGNLVHALEHGRIEIQYKPSLPAKEVKQLEGLFEERIGAFGPEQYMLIFANRTGMPYDVAATAWGHILACPNFNPRVFDAIRAFRQQYTLKAPEFIPQPE